MTSRRFLRIYGLAGTQKEIICFNGTPICMRSHDNIIFICYGSQETSAVNYSIFYIDDDELNRDAEHGILPLSEDSKLEWMGFSDEGNPFFYDSNGYLFTKCSTVSKKRVWTPYSDLRFELKHKSDNYWLVGIAERNQMIKTILCRASKYPLVLPRPTLTMMSINVPLCETDTEKTKLEKDYWKNRMSALSMRSFDCSSNPNIDMDQEELEEKIDKFENSSREILMKLFMFSCKSGKEQRAYEVATIMDSNALQLAIKYATKTRALVLAQNLNILAEKKAVIEYEKERKRQEEEERENRSHFGSRQMHSNDYVTNEIQQDTSIKLSSTNHDQIGDDIIFESENQSTMKSSNTQLTSNCTLDDSLKSCLTPTNIPLTTTRLNPFKANGSAIKTPLNDASKSIINELEEKINKQSASKEKDQWKPTPTRKLTKSKVSNTPTGSISSFLTKN
jgi:chromosome transmission fidelity protein 4